MLPALYLLLAPLAAVPADDPAVRLRLSSDARYFPGDRARVWVEAAEDGYLVVLRADVSGRVRVLFPRDPGDDAFVRGGREYELRDRGDRAGFFVDDRDGMGIVLAAWSRDTFAFAAYVRADHWDYRLLGPVADDAEAGLLDIVHRMAGGARFEYDEVRYAVGDATAYDGGVASPYRVGVHMSFGYPSYGYFGYPFYRYYGATGCWGPAFYGPWGMCPYGRYWFSSGSPFFFDVRYPYPFGYGYPGYYYPRTTTFGRARAAGRPGYLMPREREPARRVEPRPRASRGSAYEPRRGSHPAPRGRDVRPSIPVPVRARAPAQPAAPVKVRH